MGKKIKGELVITNKYIQFPGTLYQFKNITRVRRYRVKRKYKYHIHSIIITAVFPIIIFFLKDLLELPEDLVSQTFAISWIVTIVLLLVRFAPSGRFAFEIETSSGSSDFFESRNVKFIDETIDTIRSVMANEDKEINYTVNINNEKVMGDKFENIIDSDITNRSNVD